MLVLPSAGLTYLAVPKTGSTAVEQALSPFAEMTFQNERKHITAQRYKRKVAPFLKSAFGLELETVAVMREPIAQLRSWYRYRTRPNCPNAENATTGMSFDDFVSAAISEAPPPYARVGSQFAFLCNGKQLLLVDHLFAYDAQQAFQAFLSNRLARPLSFRNANMSPNIPTPLSPNVESALRQAREHDFALYDALKTANGYLGPT